MEENGVTRNIDCSPTGNEMAANSNETDFPCFPNVSNEINKQYGSTVLVLLPNLSAVLLKRRKRGTVCFANHPICIDVFPASWHDAATCKLIVTWSVLSCFTRQKTA